MADTIAGILGLIAFASVILSGLVDSILSTRWAKVYFTSGVLLFAHNISIVARHTNIPSPSLLDTKLSSYWMGGFIFEELYPNQYAFRQKFFSLAPRPMMHGLVTFDIENDQVTVKGYLDWFMVSFSIMWLILIPLAWLIGGTTFGEQNLLLPAIGYVAFYAFIFGLLYLIDFFRLMRIATVAAELWTRKYVAD